jgi:hypothetical protein
LLEEDTMLRYLAFALVLGIGIGIGMEIVGLSLGTGGTSGHALAAESTTKPKEYGVLSEAKLPDLAARTTSYINEGWVPIGGVAIMPPNEYCGRAFYQAMVKY